MDNSDLILALLGVRKEDVPVAVFDKAGNFKGTQSYDEYHGIIEGEIVKTETAVPLPYSDILEQKR